MMTSMQTKSNLDRKLNLMLTVTQDCTGWTKKENQCSLHITRDVTEPANIRIRHVQNPSDSDVDLLREQNYQLL